MKKVLFMACCAFMAMNRATVASEDQSESKEACIVNLLNEKLSPQMRSFKDFNLFIR